MVVIFISFFLICLATLGLIMFIGLLASKFIANGSGTWYSNLFLSLIIGLLLLTTLYSIFCTAGKTISLLILILGFLYAKREVVITKPKVRVFNFIKELTSYTFIAALCCVPFYIFEFFYFVKTGEFNFVVTHLDFNDYAITSKSIAEFGNENRYYALNHLYPKDYNGVSPYHYFELWFSIMISKLFSISPIKALILVSYPCAKAILFVSIINLAKFILKESLIVCIFASLFLMFISGVYMPFYEEYELTKYFIGYTQSGAMAWGKKYLIIYIISVASLMHFLQKKHTEALIILMVLPILSIGTAPATFASVGCLLLFLAFKERKIKDLSSYAIVVVLFVAFYKLFTVRETINNVGNYALFSLILSAPLDISLYKKFVFYAVFPFIRTIIIYSPYLLIILYLNYVSRRANKKLNDIEIILYSLICLLLFFGSIGSALLNGIYDSGQLLYNILPLINLIIGTLILIRLSYINKITTYIFTFIPLALFHLFNNHEVFKDWTPKDYNIHSDLFKKDCIGLLEVSPQSEVIAFVMRDEFYDKGPIVSRYSNPCYFLQFNSKGCYFIDINILKSFSRPENLSAVEVSTFKGIYEYAVFSEKNRASSNDFKIQNHFLKQFKVSYLYLQNGADLPENFEKSFKINKAINDSITGDKLINFSPISL